MISKKLSPSLKQQVLIRWLLLPITIFLFAFTDSAFFRSEFDYAAMLSRFETLPPAVEYTDKLGIEIEGYYTEKRNTAGFVSLNPYMELIDISKNTLKEMGYKSFQVAPLSGKEKPDSIGLFFSGGDRIPFSRLMFTPDPSIHHTSETKPVEIVSPILENKNDVDAFFAILESLNQKVAFTAEPLKSGTHFHFDFQKPQPEEILVLTIVMEKILPELKTLFSIQHSRMAEFAQPYSADDFKNLVHFTETEKTLTQTDGLGIHRHRSNNWLSLKKHGTFEFRAFNSTSDSQLLSIQADLIQKIIKAVRRRDPKLIDLLKSPRLSQLTLNNIASTLDCLLAKPQIVEYVRAQTEKEVTYSKKIFHQLKAQPDLAGLRTPNLGALLDSPFLGSIRAQGLLRYSETPIQQQHTHSNYEYGQVTIRLSPEPETNRCRQFYEH